MHKSVAEQLLDVSWQLHRRCSPLRFTDPVAYVYDPLSYAWAPFSNYVRTFGDSPKRVLFLGLNPGPWGMAQVGVPFGEVAAVRDWLGIRGPVGKPPKEHPKRAVTGFDCPRSEVSGRRLWGLFAQRFGPPAAFFREHFVINYCPLLFLDESARNRTPDRLPMAEKEALYEVCNVHLRTICAVLQVEWVIGVGKVAAAQAEDALRSRDVQIGTIIHPSPANPQANRGWYHAAVEKLEQYQIW